MPRQHNHIGTAYQGPSGACTALMDVVAKPTEAGCVEIEFYDNGKVVFACTLECVDSLIHVGVEALAKSDYPDVWVSVPNPNAAEDVAEALGRTTKILRQLFAVARTEISRLEAECGLLPLPEGAPISITPLVPTQVAV